MKRVYKILAALSTTAIMLSACITAFSASAVLGLEISNIDGYDLYCRQKHEYLNADKELQCYYTDDYYKFTDEYSGERYEYHDKYTCVMITVNENADLKELKSANGPALDRYAVAYYTPMEDNQYAYEYSEDIDYEGMYSIKGVEKVEIGKITNISKFSKRLRFYSDDKWAVENNYFELDTGDPDYPKNLLMSTVKTENDKELTVDMFADTGFKVENVYKLPEPNLWYVYFDYDGIKSYMDFDLNVEKIDGIISSDVLMSVYDSGKNAMRLDTVIPFDSSEYVKGDISGNGKVDLYDAIEIAKSLIGSRKFNLKEKAIADFNGDGRVDLYDAIEIAKTLLMQHYAKTS